jgi:CheY-like chemotaxis protein
MAAGQSLDTPAGCNARGASRCDASPVPLSCLIVDDNPEFLAAATQVLEGEGVTVAGTAATSADALRRARDLRPDVVLVDIDLGAESGFDVARRLDADARTPIILISTYGESDFAELVAETPALGFLSKSDLSRRAIDALMGSRPR